MDKEEIDFALEEIESMVDRARKTHSMAGFVGLVHSANTLRVALERQLPAEPLTRPGTNTLFEYISICPNCGNTLKSQADFCSHCGQRIDWSEEKEVAK